MGVKIKFFARFRDLFGREIMVDPAKETSLIGLMRDVTSKNKEGYDTLFDEHGSFRKFVIVMRNGKRIDPAHAERIMVVEGDEIAVFPPVAGG